jgi:Nitrile hydratase, alpha chain
MNRHEIETRLIEQASADPAFRQRLLADPKSALAELLGVALPPGMTVTVLEEQPGQHILVLPPAQPEPDALPMDDLELALVGGGRTLRPFAIKCAVENTKSSSSNANSSQRSSC